MTSSTTQTNGFDGDYIGQIQGTATNLRLTTRGSTLSGNANAGGYIYNLTFGTTDNSKIYTWHL